MRGTANKQTTEMVVTLPSECQHYIFQVRCQFILYINLSELTDTSVGKFMHNLIKGN